MKIALVAITARGLALAATIQPKLPGSEIVTCRQGVRRCLEQSWHDFDALVCIMAAGIAVRCLGPLCRSKYTDPCVVVVDEQGCHAISLLSGHIGGGNQLAEKIARICAGRAVITTASDVSGHTALDLWAVENNLTVAEPDRLASVSTRLLDRGRLAVFQDRPYLTRFPGDLMVCREPAEADIVVSLKPAECRKSLHLLPRIHYIGFGCRRGATVTEFEAVLVDLEREHGLDLRSVAGVATIDLKEDEIGLRELAVSRRWPIRFFAGADLNKVPLPVPSATVFKKIGAYGVCEPAAILAASADGRPGTIIISKRKWTRITAAVAVRADSA